MTRRILHAPAKLTLSLRVTGICDRDPFRGYHLIDAVMTTLDLHDVIELEERPAGSPSRVTYTGKYSSGLDGSPGTDLVSRALHAVNRSAEVTVTKNIPHGGGLGGGSADAAAILRWAGVTDLDVAASIGADVAFCLVAQSAAGQSAAGQSAAGQSAAGQSAAVQGRARVRGIGEIVEPMDPERPGDPAPGTVTLIVPPFSVSTPAVYRAFDEIHPVGNPGNAISVSGVNDLESAAMVVEPRLRDWKELIAEKSGQSPTLAGSGSTWFVMGDHGYLATRLPEATVVVTRYQ